ncbi:serine protease inhibitor swm-1-like [Halictus rubicundus]|uniref:serine protease inhibitor swm-1-like n=1 Tax=Halictus rubicundus TaxID=77578 RepID=UPI0040371DB7
MYVENTLKSLYLIVVNALILSLLQYEKFISNILTLINRLTNQGAPGGDRCPPSEDWDVCGTACQLTCENPKPRICTLPCVIGCQCKPGLLRNESGDCVPKESCPADGPESCSPHEEWNDCGTACPLTCENPEPRVCTKECVSRGCHCKPGLLRNKFGRCVPKKWCCS